MKTFNVVTEEMTHFDCRDIEDVINSRKRWNDWTKTINVWDNDKMCWTDDAPEIEWNRIEQERIN